MQVNPNCYSGGGGFYAPPSYLLQIAPKPFMTGYFHFLGSGPDRGRSPVEWGDFPSVRSYVRPSPPLGHPARPEAQPARPKAQPARPEAQPARPEAQPASQLTSG